VFAVLLNCWVIVGCCDRVVWSAGVLLVSYRDQLLTAVMIAVMLLLALLVLTVIFFWQSFAIKGLQPHRCDQIVFSLGVNDFMYRYAVG
jgi:hypothetical protein